MDKQVSEARKVEIAWAKRGNILVASLRVS